MDLITPEERVLRTEDLLVSVQNSIRALRKELEDLIQQIRSGEDADLSNGTKQVASAETLVRTCQKVEATLVEQSSRAVGIARGGYAIDLDQARFEIGCRLARLRNCKGAGGVSG